jgi:two-component system, OmpR family, sensor kinase
MRRTARRIALATAALFAVSIVALAGVAAALVVHTQQSDAQTVLRQAIADTDAVTDPPSGILIYESDGGRDQASPDLQHGPLDPGALASVRSGGPVRTGEVHADGREYRVRTGRRGDVTVQAALDLSDQNRERTRLLKSLGMASAVGLVLAMVIGWLIARRAIRPLGLAMDRQQRFIADASHELRTPLTQVHTRAQLLQRALRDIDDRPDLVEDADRLVRNTRQLGEIVEEMLTSAQLRSEPYSFGPIDLAEIADQVVDAEQTRALDLGVSLTVDRDEGPHVVRGSLTALRRVLNSLTDNALGHTSAGGHVTIELRSVANGPIICVVRDDGVGFAPVEADRIFERFARGGQGAGRRFGLGLALVREVVQAHDGTITAAGVAGSGAAFTVTLPAYRPR